MYIINNIIDTYSYSIRIFDILHKYQSAIIIKYHIKMINFLFLLISNNYMIFLFIANGKYENFLSL